jgi:hypothetical protein
MDTTGELICNSGQFMDQTQHTYEVIFNRLDLPHNNNGKQYVYDAEEFRTALPLFKETLLVFAKTHPKNIGKIPLEDALAEVDAKIIGTPQDVLVNNNGTLFRGSVNVTDPEAEELIKTGKALISTSFEATPDEDGVLRNIKPNHILIFPSDTKILPGDQAALFYNQAPADGSSKTRDETMSENENPDLAVARLTITNQAAEIETHKAKITTLEEKIEDGKTLIANQETEISDLKAETGKQKELISNQEAEITSLKEEVESFRNQLQEIKDNEKKARRTEIFNQYLAGTQKAFETKKEEMLDYDEKQFTNLVFEMNQYQIGVKVAPTEEEGTEHVNNQETDAELTNGVSVVKDPVTGKLVSTLIKRGV